MRPYIDNLFSYKLDSQLANSLDSQFSLKDVNEAVFSMGNDKSPGPDGFSMLFY